MFYIHVKPFLGEPPYALRAVTKMLSGASIQAHCIKAQEGVGVLLA
jgi:hypothetical protein